MKLNKTQLNQPVVKGDILELEAELKSDIAEVRQELKGDIAEVRQELKGDIAEVRQELKGDIAEVKTELKSDIAEVKKELATKASKSDVAELARQLQNKVEITDFDLAMSNIAEAFAKVDQRFDKIEVTLEKLVTGQDFIFKTFLTYKEEQSANLAAHRRYEQNFLLLNKKLKIA